MFEEHDFAIRLVQFWLQNRIEINQEQKQSNSCLIQSSYTQGPGRAKFVSYLFVLPLKKLANGNNVHVTSDIH